MSHYAYFQWCILEKKSSSIFIFSQFFHSKKKTMCPIQFEKLNFLLFQFKRREDKMVIRIEQDFTTKEHV